MALGYHFIFDELATHSRSKMAAILAKSSKIGVLPGRSIFIEKNKISHSLEERPNDVDPRQPSIILM